MRELDYGVGQILQKVKDLGIDGDTFALFSSDNGGATYAKEQGMTINSYLVTNIELKYLSCIFSYMAGSVTNS